MKQISSPRSRIQIPWFPGGASGVWNAHIVCEANQEGDPKKLITKTQQQNTALIDNYDKNFQRRETGVPNNHNFICESGQVIMIMIMIMIMIITIVIVIVIVIIIIIIIIIIINIVIISISISITIQLPLLLLLS